MPESINKDCLYFFRDKDSEAQSNFQGGLSYCAAGVVESFSNNFDGTGCPSGKDVVVLYIDPWGIPNRCWRSVDEVHLTPADLEDYQHLKNSIESEFIE